LHACQQWVGFGSSPSGDNQAPRPTQQIDNMSDTQNRNNNRDGGNRRPRRNNNNNRNRNNNNRNRSPRPPRPLKLTLEKERKKQNQGRQNNQSTGRRDTRTNNRESGPRKNNKTSRPPQKVPVETPRLYVGNLSYDATEYDIEDLFKGVGTVKKVEIIYNRNTHKSKGYGFVQMLNVEEAKRAVEVLHDQPFMGRQLVVNGSKSRKDSDPTKGRDDELREETAQQTESAE